MKLEELAIGKSAVILSVGGEGALRQHFLDMGLIQGTEVTMVKYAPMGDPMEIKIHDYELTLRKEDAHKIEIKEITKKTENKNYCKKGEAKTEIQSIKVEKSRT